MEAKGCGLMKKRNIVLVITIVLAVALLCGGCSQALQELEDGQVRQCTETMLDALIDGDLQGAYDLVRDIISLEEFEPTYHQLRELIGDVDGYELTLLSFYSSSNISDGTGNTTVSSVYEMTTQNGRLIVSIRMNSQIGLTSFHITPYENTVYHYTGTLDTLDGASAAQWVFLLLNVVVIGLEVFSLVDCCRQKFQKKTFWIVLLALGFITVGATISTTGFRVNLNVAWLTDYSALIFYGSGAATIRLMLPMGAILYWFQRKKLLKENSSAEPTPESLPEDTPADPG